MLGEKDLCKEKLKESYKGTTKEFFKESINLERMQNEYENKVSSLDSLLFDLNQKKFDELNLDEDQYNSVHLSESISNLYLLCKAILTIILISLN